MLTGGGMESVVDQAANAKHGKESGKLRDEKKMRGGVGGGGGGETTDGSRSAV